MKQKSFIIFLVCFLSCVFGGLVYEACKDNAPSEACFDCTDFVINQFCQSTCNTCVNINGTNKSVSATSILFGQPRSDLKYLIGYNDSQDCFLDMRINDSFIYCNPTNWTEFYLVDVPSTISLPSTDQFQLLSSVSPGSTVYSFFTKIIYVSFGRSLFGQYSGFPTTNLYTFQVNPSLDLNLINLEILILQNSFDCFNFNSLTVRVYLLVSQDTLFNNVFIDLQNMLYDYSKLYLSNEQFLNFNLTSGLNKIDLLNLYSFASKKYFGSVNYIGIIVMPENRLPVDSYCNVYNININLNIAFGTVSIAPVLWKLAITFNTNIELLFNQSIKNHPLTSVFTYKVNLFSNVVVSSLNFSIDNSNNCNVYNNLKMSIYLLVSQGIPVSSIDEVQKLYDYSMLYLSNKPFVDFVLQQGYNRISLVNLFNDAKNNYRGIVNYISIIVIFKNISQNDVYCEVNQNNVALVISYGKDIVFQGAVSFQSVNDNKYLRHSNMVIRLDNFLSTDYAGDRSYYIHQKNSSFSIQSAHPAYLLHFIRKYSDNFKILQNANVPAFTLVVTNLMIKKIESINKYSVNITITLPVTVWNSTTYFEIKCNDLNDVNLYLKQLKLVLNPVISYIANISSLQSYTLYKFSAGVKNEFGFYVYGQVFRYQTDEDVPAGYPRNFTFKVVNFTTLFLSWADVESLMRKGVILNYIYSCNNTENSLSNKVDNSTFNLTVYNLNPDTIYHCSVAACTRVGCGVQASVFNITLAGIPSGPPLNFVVAPFSFSSLLLSWDKVEYSKSNGTINLYKYSCSNEINTWYTVDKNTFQVIVGNLAFNTTYNCTITACTWVGCGVQSSLFNTTLNGSPEESANITYIHNINSSSINVSWNDISFSKWGIHENQLFCLDIENSSQIVKTECVEYVGKHNTIINGLDPYTKYAVLVYCKNKVGVGFKDNNKKKSVFTDELPPLVSPKNISVDSNSTNSILLQWKPLDQNEYYGVLTGYSIIVKAVYSESDFKLQSKRKRRGLDMQIYNGSLLLEWETNLSNPNATFFNITSLFGNTIYIINISANTKYQGKFSSGVQIKTKEGVPLVSAVNLQCDIITDCSISIRWQPTPPGYLQGILIGYTLSYQKVDTGKIQYESLNTEFTSYNVINLNAFTNYNIVLIALTKNGGGKNSQLTCKTDEAVPIKAPTGLTATSYYYPDKTNVSWIHISQNDWKGRPLGYTIAYKLLKQGDVDIPNQPWVMVNITYTNQPMHQLENLGLYSQYSLKIAGYNRKGVGSFSGVINFVTCHILNPVVEINYISLPPFVSSNKSSQFPPEGIMIAPTEHSLKQCAGICSSFSENISFAYTKVQKTSLEFVKMSSNKIKLPVTVPVQVYNSSYSSTVQLSGFVFLFIPSNTSVQLAENEQIVFKNTASSLATLVIYILLNCLFGVILFYCQYQNSQRKSHCFTLSGIFEEIYFSIVTITTVGYGDKIPLTFCGRVLLIIWTFMGIVLTSICVGNIISALTVDVVSSVIDLYPKYSVIAKLGSPEYLWANKISSINLIKDKNFSSHSDVLDGLKEGQAKYAVFDQYTIEAYRVVMMQFNIKVAKVFNTDNSYYGVSLGGNYSLLQSCMNGLLKNSSAMVASAMYDFKMDAMQQSNSTHMKLKKTQIQLFSIQSPIFRMMLSGMAYVLLSLLIAGSVYEILRIKWIKKPRVAPSLDKKLAYLQEMKNLSQEYLIEFHNMIERLQINTEILLYKHAEQRYKLRNKFSKLYGVNFKYVTLNDLGVSLEQIAEFREEIKRRPKKTCWQRFSEYAVKKLSWLRIKIFK
nr:uncharacterized protein LOC105844328 isoform X1 [Hydra vulgaris]